MLQNSEEKNKIISKFYVIFSEVIPNLVKHHILCINKQEKIGYYIKIAVIFLIYLNNGFLCKLLLIFALILFIDIFSMLISN